MGETTKHHGKKTSTAWQAPPADFSYVLFERVNPLENANRYYYLGWLPTLLHAKAVVRMYGRKGQSQRLVTPQPFDSLESAWPLIRSIIKARLRHGYRVVQPEVYQGLAGRAPEVETLSKSGA